MNPSLPGPLGSQLLGGRLGGGVVGLKVSDERTLILFQMKKSKKKDEK